jgi:hypothetical protein
MKKSSNRRLGEIVLLAICFLVAAGIVWALVRTGTASGPMYLMLSAILTALLLFVRPWT